ncbi:MAG: adenosylcobinamide-phosphate synthase CbiB [Shimia sp.]
MTLLAALLVDALLGEPRWLYDRVPHPAILMGRAVAWLDARLNRGRHRRARGIVALLLLLGGAVAVGLTLGVLPWWLQALAAATLLAQRSLLDHVGAVATALDRDLTTARAAVAMIVGRDTAAMDPPAIARAAVESGAENFGDGVVAPAFWLAVAGLPGLVAYKAVNTADSMIGYRTPRHAAFGWAAARCDDVLNWVPARVAALLIAAATRPPGRGFGADARRHRSPNAGWPEAAMAHGLGIALSGPRSYGGALEHHPWVHAAGRKALGAADIRAACRALWRAWALGVALVGASLLLTP